MPKTSPWRDIRDRRLSEEARERVDETVERELLKMSLAELRKEVAGLTQVETAELLRVTQSAISQLEKREDLLVSNLADYVRVLGGQLELRVTFPDREDVRITQFEDLRGQVVATRR